MHNNFAAKDGEIATSSLSFRFVTPRNDEESVVSVGYLFALMSRRRIVYCIFAGNESLWITIGPKFGLT